VKKAYYALSLMNKGVAKAWKDRYIDGRTGQDLTTTWDAFKTALTGSFTDPGSVKDAMTLVVATLMYHTWPVSR